MYNLPYHKEIDDAVVSQFIDEHPFAFLTGCDAESKPIATQIPLFIEDKDVKKFLRGHFMKNTDHHKAFMQNPNVLAVFSGPHTYVSGTWYSNPHTPSTWNYMSVHAKGIIQFLDDEALAGVLRKTSLHFEDYNKQSPTVFDNLPEEFTAKMTKAIVAFEIEITHMDNVFKLSQDRDEESFENIIQKLKQKGGDAQVIANEMAKRKKELFHRK